MFPYFRNQEYSRGLYNGVQGVIDVVLESQPSWISKYIWHLLTLIGVAFVAVCICAWISVMQTGTKGWGTAFFIAAVIIPMRLLHGYAKMKWRRSIFNKTEYEDWWN